MDQAVAATSSQVTQSGPIINCHGGNECPMRRATDRRSPDEWGAQKEFKRRTGIECSRRARLALDAFLLSHNVTSGQVRTAWRNLNLLYDEDTDRLVARVYVMEMVWGAVVFALGMLLISPSLLSVLSMSAGSPLAVAMLTVAAYVLAMAVYAYNFIAPNLIGRRLVLMLGDPEAQGAGATPAAETP